MWSLDWADSKSGRVRYYRMGWLIAGLQSSKGSRQRFGFWNIEMSIN